MSKNLLTTKVSTTSDQEKFKLAVIEPLVDKSSQRKLMKYVHREFDYFIFVSDAHIGTRQIGIVLTEDEAPICKLQNPTRLHLHDEAELHFITSARTGEELKPVIESRDTDVGTELLWETGEELEQFLEEVSND